MRPSITVIDNHEETLTNFLVRQLDGASSARFATAFIRLSGLNSIEDQLNNILMLGDSVEIIFGLDFRISEPKAVEWLIQTRAVHTNLNFYAFSNPAQDKVPVFHPKLYIVERPEDQCCFVVGSSNLTESGFERNIELNLAIEASKLDLLTEQIFSIYDRFRKQETIFRPDEAYLEDYERIYKRVRNEGRKALRDQRTQELLKKLKRREDYLEGPAPTQRGLIIQAMKNLAGDAEGYVHLRDISTWVEAKAKELALPYKWDTLCNSIRGRLNAHTVGKDGDDFFIRKGGVAGRLGLYRLSDEGQAYQGR